MSNKANKKNRNAARPKKEFDEAVIQIDRVTRVVKGGRRLRFRATVVIGNKQGQVGLGLGKSVEVSEAIRKAVTQAKKELVVIPLNNGTIPHNVKVKFKSSKILLLPASEGTGLIAGGSVRKILELAGVKNVLSKSLGSSNRVNNAKATIEALKELKETPYMIRAKALASKAPVKAEANAQTEEKVAVKKAQPKAEAKPKAAAKKPKADKSE